MFWKVIEFIVKLIFFRRFRQADKIGDAGRLLCDGDPKGALAELDRLEAQLHPSLISIHAYTRGMAFNVQDRLDEARAAFIRSREANPDGTTKADLELAVIAGRRFEFEECRQWLDKLDEKVEGETKERAGQIRALLDDVTSGNKRQEFEERARKMARRPIGPNGESPELPANIALLDDWIGREPKIARQAADELAILIGHSAVLEKGASWRISLGISDSVIEFEDGRELNPFTVVAMRLDNESTKLNVLWNV